MPTLFEPFRLRDVTFRNRLAVSPMCQYQAGEGLVNDFHLVHYGKFALGGFGLVMVEATAISPNGRITHGDLGIWSDDHTDGLTRVASFVKRNGSVAGIQIGHAGPKASLLRPWDGDSPVPEVPVIESEHRWPLVAASAVAPFKDWPMPSALDLAGIAAVRADFVSAARRALAAGFDVLEVHCAHGFLLNSFLSPLSNKREDTYGGSLENRMRLIVEIVSDVRKIWPQEKPLFVRLSTVDGSLEGWSVNDSIALARELKRIGVDVIDNSSGGFGIYQYPTGYGYQVSFSDAVRKGADIATMAVGLVVDPHQAEAIVADGQADIVAVGHAALKNPHFAFDAQQALGAVTPDAPFEEWERQYGWWLNNRAKRLSKLGPLNVSHT